MLLTTLSSLRLVFFLLSKMKLLTLQTYVRVFNSLVVHQTSSSCLSLNSYLSRPWRRSKFTMVVFAQSLLSEIQILLLNIHKRLDTSPTHMISDYIFGVGTKVLFTNTITSVIKDYVNAFPDFLIISTDSYVIVIVIVRIHFSLCSYCQEMKNVENFHSGAVGSRASATKSFEDTSIVTEFFYPLFQSLISEPPRWVYICWKSL